MVSCGVLDQAKRTAYARVRELEQACDQLDGARQNRGGKQYTEKDIAKVR
jgi:hypothetical protein